MFPGNTIEDITHSRFTKPIFMRKGCFGDATCDVSLSDFCYLLFCHLRTWNRCSLCLTPFIQFVLNIIVIGSQKQMIWTNATRIITVMTNHKVMRDRPVFKLVRQSVNENGSPYSMEFDGDFSIAFGRKRSCPCPTVVGFLNLIPKTVFQRDFSMDYATSGAAKPTVTTQNIGAESYKGFATVLTGAFKFSRGYAMMLLHSDLQSGCRAPGC